MKSLMFRTILAGVAVGLSAGNSVGQAKGPATSAYEGNVGDWALGRWEGYLFPNYANSPMKTEDGIMIVQRLPDGKVGCRWAVPADLPRVGWAPHCKITATGLTLVTTADSEVELELKGAELEGRMRAKNSTRYRAQLKRVQ